MPATLEPEKSVDIAGTLEQLLTSIGQRVRELRRARKLTQRQLADKVGTGHTYVTAVESGVQNLTLETLVKIALVLGVTVRDLLPASKYELPSARTFQDLQVAISDLKPDVQACAEQGEAAAVAFAQLSEIHKAIVEMTHLMTGPASSDTNDEG